jgi:uncharacterized protein YuzE
MADPAPLEMAVLAHEQQEWLSRILAANDDLAERIQALGVSMDYDEEDDALFVSFGPGVEALTGSVNGAVYLRIDPDTLKIIGVEVWRVRTLMTEAPTGLRFWWHATEALTAGLRRQLNEREEPALAPQMFDEHAPVPIASERLAADIRELIGV